jgi:hypothetical protein
VLELCLNSSTSTITFVNKGKTYSVQPYITGLFEDITEPTSEINFDYKTDCLTTSYSWEIWTYYVKD